jgi:putative FmdB family regulatory protein
MPTYDYECQACEHTFEHFQGINDPHLKKCPECGKPKLKRLIGAGGAVVFKGSGFYQTDYRCESYKKSAAAESKSGDSSSTASESKSTESKPAAETKSSETKSPPVTKPASKGKDAT